ncbi:MAG: dihydrofolate reductase [Alphaproteobacteria bacterium]|nr:dihydrofolate reductase [Alphaproteobacteria bacterium]
MSQNPVTPTPVSTRLSLIAARADKGVIGGDNQLLWRLSGDLKHFKALTLGKPIVMGRKTFDSIGRPLPGRETIVITRDRNWQRENVLVAHDLAAGLALAKARALAMGASEVMIAGGAEIYRQTIGIADYIYLTEVALERPGDAFFPDLDPAHWQKMAHAPQTPGPGDEAPYDFIEYARRRLDGTKPIGQDKSSVKD